MEGEAVPGQAHQLRGHPHLQADEAGARHPPLVLQPRAQLAIPAGEQQGWVRKCREGPGDTQGPQLTPGGLASAGVSWVAVRLSLSGAPDRAGSLRLSAPLPHWGDQGLVGEGELACKGPLCHPSGDRNIKPAPHHMQQHGTQANDSPCSTNKPCPFVWAPLGRQPWSIPHPQGSPVLTLLPLLC